MSDQSIAKHSGDLAKLDAYTEYILACGYSPEEILRAALAAFLKARGKELDTSGAGELVIPCKGGENLNVPAIFLTL